MESREEFFTEKQRGVGKKLEKINAHKEIKEGRKCTSAMITASALLSMVETLKQVAPVIKPTVSDLMTGV